MKVRDVMNELKNGELLTIIILGNYTIRSVGDWKKERQLMKFNCEKIGENVIRILY